MSNEIESNEHSAYSVSSAKVERGPKLSLRQKYLLEKQSIQNEFGNLSQILTLLGLNQRKICQLLLVDPSAWTRWIKTDAPPHIYQALKWLILLKKADPNIVGGSDLSSRVDYLQSNLYAKLKSLEENIIFLERKLVLQSVTKSDSAAGLQSEIQRLRQLILKLKSQSKSKKRVKIKKRIQSPKRKAQLKARKPFRKRRKRT